MSVICKECGKHMPTQVILELHLKKRHGGDSGEVKTVIKPEVKIETPKVGEQVITPEIKKEVESGMVEIESVDGRELEASVGTTIWKGKVIIVPKEMEEDVRRLLIEGGFFIK